MRRRGYLRSKRRIARHRGPRRRVDWRQLAQPLPAWREAILSAPRRAAASFGQGDVLEGNCAFYVFASEHGCILPLYKHPDVRGGHGMEGVGRRLRCRSSSSNFFVKRHGACWIWTAEEWQRPQLKGGSDGATREGDVKLRRHAPPRWSAPARHDCASAGSSKAFRVQHMHPSHQPHGTPPTEKIVNNTRELHNFLDSPGPLPRSVYETVIDRLIVK
jgi:hypothetical protein